MKPWIYENQQWRSLSKDLNHLPLFTDSRDWSRWCLWAMSMLGLRGLFHLYVRAKVVGKIYPIYKKFPRLLVISNHSSHADTPCIISSIPFRCLFSLYICVAKDYWFSGFFISFFSKNCLKAIPIDRIHKKAQSVLLCKSLLLKLDRAWVLIYPEGSRSEDGYIKKFKRGISILSQATGTPILFLYIDGMSKLMPKGKWVRPGRITVYVGPVQPPAEIDVINQNYKDWVLGINPNAYARD